jgi:hypothetical protein
MYSLPGIIMRGCHALISADSVDLGAQSDRICTPSASSNLDCSAVQNGGSARGYHEPRTSLTA